MLLAFEPFVDFERRLSEQEEPAADQDQVAAGNALAENREQRRRQAYYPRNRHQQQNAHHHRGHQPGAPRLQLIRRRQLARQDRDEDDVVDAENDFEEGERDEREQAVGGQEGVHVSKLTISLGYLRHRRR